MIPCSGRNASSQSPSRSATQFGGPLNPMFKKNPTRNSSLSPHNTLVSSCARLWSASIMPSSSAPSSEPTPKCSNSSPPPIASAAPNSTSSSPWPQKSSSQAIGRRASGRRNNSSAYGDGVSTLIAASSPTATMSCTIRMPIATRPCTARSSRLPSSTLAASTVLEKPSVMASKNESHQEKPAPQRTSTAPAAPVSTR